MVTLSTLNIIKITTYIFAHIPIPSCLILLSLFYQSHSISPGRENARQSVSAGTLAGLLGQLAPPPFNVLLNSYGRRVAYRLPCINGLGSRLLDLVEPLDEEATGQKNKLEHHAHEHERAELPHAIHVDYTEEVQRRSDTQ